MKCYAITSSQEKSIRMRSGLMRWRGMKQVGIEKWNRETALSQKIKLLHTNIHTEKRVRIAQCRRMTGS